MSMIKNLKIDGNEDDGDEQGDGQNCNETTNKLGQDENLGEDDVKKVKLRQQQQQTIEKREETSLRSFNFGNLARFLIIVTSASLISIKYFDEQSSNSKLSTTIQLPNKPNVPLNCGLAIRPQLQMRILKTLNDIRSKVAKGQYSNGTFGYLPTALKMPSLKWDCQLELEASNRAKTCELEQLRNEDFQTTDLKDFRGETSFFFRSTSEILDDNEKALLNGIEKMGAQISEYGLDSVEVSKIDKRIGHAMQIIWETTTTVACSFNKCDASSETSPFGDEKGFNLAICKYFPSGNIFNLKSTTRIYTPGAVGESCNSETTILDPITGLCVEI